MTDDEIVAEFVAELKKKPLSFEWGNGPFNARDRMLRFAHAYLMLAKERYRPQAPSDGFGHIQLSKSEFMDEDRLYREAIEYGIKFLNDDERQEFYVGSTNWETNRASVLVIEAARLLAGGFDNEPFAISLLKRAIKEIEQVGQARAKRRAA